MSRACLALVLLAACAGPPDPLGGEGRPITEEPVSFGSGGRAASLALPPFDGESLALWARTDPSACFAIDGLEAGGRTVVSAREAGPYCIDCAVRTSVAQGEALFVLSRGAELDPSAGLAVRFGLMRCETLTPLDVDDARAELELAWLPRETIPARGRVSLRFLIAAHASLSGRPDRSRALLDALNRELEGTGLEATLDGVIDLRGAPAEATFSTTELDALERLVAGTPPAPRFTIDVVVAACLRYDDPFFGPPVSVEGFTPRVGGGAGPASAIFLPALRCDAPGVVDPDGRVLAHELGHFLGLYHSVEADGTTDLLRDTDEENIMHHTPALALARGFSPTQARRMRAHPWVRPRSSP